MKISKTIVWSIKIIKLVCKMHLRKNTYGLLIIVKKKKKKSIKLNFPGGSEVKESAMQETWVRSLGQEDSLKEEMATHSSTLAWRIPWTEEPGGLQSTESQRVGYD